MSWHLIGCNSRPIAIYDFKIAHYLIISNRNSCFALSGKRIIINRQS
jgi:hypothetical protein